jgi:hypothetical protein
VAVAFTNGETAEQTFLVDGQVAVTDMMGNREVPTLGWGGLRITMSGDPTYIVLGPKGTIRPVWSELRVQPNLAIPTLGASVVVPSVAKPKGKPALPPSAAISGDWTCYSSAGAWNGSRRGWDEADDGKDAFPDAFEVRLPRPAPVARVRVCHDYGAWERLLRDYDVQVHVGGAWQTVDRVRHNRYRFIVDHQFKPVTTDRVRILVHMVNSCLFENMHWIPKLTTLRAVEVYGPPGGEAKAFFVHDVPRRRVLKPGDETMLAFKLHNVTDAELVGEVRLVLPEGVSAVASAPARLPAEGVQVCLFKVRLAADAAAGLYTVLAEFRHEGRLACPDREPIVLCCKTLQGK